MGGWRLHWLTRPTPRDLEPGEGSDAMTGAYLTVSQVQSIPWAATPPSASLLLVTSVFVTPIITRGNAAKPLTRWAAATVGAPVSFRENETGAGWRKEMPTRIDRSGAATKTNRPPWRSTPQSTPALHQADAPPSALTGGIPACSYLRLRRRWLRRRRGIRRR